MKAELLLNDTGNSIKVTLSRARRKDLSQGDLSDKRKRFDRDFSAVKCEKALNQLNWFKTLMKDAPRSMEADEMSELVWSLRTSKIPRTGAVAKAVRYYKAVRDAFRYQDEMRAELVDANVLQARNIELHAKLAKLEEKLAKLEG